MNPLQSSSSEMRYSHRCWKVHWSHVQAAYATLQADYASADIDHNKLRFDADIFFLLAGHLSEWTAGDREAGCALERTTQLGNAERDELKLVMDFANTTKHHSRDDNDKDEVYVDVVRISPQGSSAEIVHKYPDGSVAAIRDALEVATNFMAVWDRLLAADTYWSLGRRRRH
ncbi:hypothetical protein D477_014271 [Arthrobacter crystallopoietes BAB-32]|uniref:Uncharacterized protein n=1 Tax=Arthrobacter crystallopoietes BAB-32 TaxID=1246476 RepID=N1V0K3_9MICC|nr:hypothetical protein [Arthrobacter crystallopoietes]EMY33574.1 hypothetical protein D477_014271 [Arthrobacter crystallopoietes BAB-32]